VQVRLHALKAENELYARLGEEFLILLPETIPFLAETMEGMPAAPCSPPPALDPRVESFVWTEKRGALCERCFGN
jgi:hypothetical protein